MNIAGFEFGSLPYMGMVWGFAAVLVPVCAAMFKQSLRVGGASSWIALAVFASLADLLTMPLATFMRLGASYAVPMFGVAFVLSFPHMHLLIPRLAPDYHSDSVGASLTLALVAALALVIAGAISGDIVHIVPGYVLDGFQVDIPDE